jgi:hemolysin activation/secretion protein
MNARFFCPVKVGDIEFSLNSSLRLQHNGTLLTSQDRISIGGRYSVRGFDGEYTLSGDRGAVWRNEIDYNYMPNHKIYFGVDAGYVGGRSANNLLGNSLVGTFVGLKGIFNYGVNIDYDFFVGTPVEKPKGFSTKSIASGFSLSFSY